MVPSRLGAEGSRWGCVSKSFRGEALPQSSDFVPAPKVSAVGAVKLQLGHNGEDEKRKLLKKDQFHGLERVCP